MKTAPDTLFLHQSVALRHSKGFALITELISLLVFGLGVLALSSLSNKTVTSNSESLQKIHATWLANSLISRQIMNPTEARSLRYKQDNVNCANTPSDRISADLTYLFCSDANPAAWEQTKTTDIMGEFEWDVTCEDSNTADAVNCSSNSLFTVSISWDAPGSNINTPKTNVSYTYYF